MLVDSGMEEKFWVEAASIAVYLINSSPSSAIEYKLPEELWSWSKSILKHLRRFRCAAYVQTVSAKTSPREVRKKSARLAEMLSFHEEEVSSRSS